MTREYLAQLTEAYSNITEVWLFGSRANGTAHSESDWDYLAFWDGKTALFDQLHTDRRFLQDDIDLLVLLTNGDFS